MKSTGKTLMIVTLLLVAGACGGAATVSSAPTQSADTTPTPRPTLWNSGATCLLRAAYSDWISADTAGTEYNFPKIVIALKNMLKVYEENQGKTQVESEISEMKTAIAEIKSLLSAAEIAASNPTKANSRAYADLTLGGNASDPTGNWKLQPCS